MLSHPVLFGVLLVTNIVLYVGIVIALSVRADRRLKAMRREEQR
jgi:hypothetical protein